MEYIFGEKPMCNLPCISSLKDEELTVELSRFVQVACIAIVFIGTSGPAVAYDDHDHHHHHYYHHHHDDMGAQVQQKSDYGWKEGDLGGFKNMENRELTAGQVRIVAEARLIMQGNDNVKIGDVKETSDGFTVSIVTIKSGDLVRTMELAKNGMPMKAMEGMEQRMKNREARKSTEGKKY